MKPLTDDEWLREARERVAHGDNWQTPAAEMLAPAPAASAPAIQAGSSPACAFCADRPGMIVFERPGATAVVPLWYCTICYGFWAPKGSIDDGVTGSYADSPAIDAVQAPRRCRACFGYLKLDGTCSKCGQPLPLLNCPDGHGPMERFEKDGVTLDSCKECSGIWFDIGEISAVYHLSPAQSMTMGAVDEAHAMQGAMPPEWLRALSILSRLLLPLIGL